MTAAVPDWFYNAKCQIEKKPTEFFYPSERNLKETNAAKAYCRGCVCRIACLHYAMSINSVDGIFGGATYQERCLMSALLPKEVSEHDPSDTPKQISEFRSRTLLGIDTSKLELPPFSLDPSDLQDQEEDQEYHSQPHEEVSTVQVESGFSTWPQFNLAL